MGRRALSRIDSSLDLSRWLVAEEMLPDELRGESLFHRPAPLEIELGSGKGLFLARATEECPEHNFVGIEITRKYARFAAAGLAKCQRANGVVVHGDGLCIFRHRIPDASVHAVHVYFPDPWWKKRHQKRRVMNAAFLRDVQRVLRDLGTLHFWTDVHAYYQATLALIRDEIDLEGPTDSGELPAEHDLDFRTHFERRMRLNCRPVYRSLFVKP